MTSLGTPKRHPESGIFWFRKRVPDRLREVVGKSEIKHSLRTRDLGIARIRYLEAALQIERDWVRLTNPLIDTATVCTPIPVQALAVEPIVDITSSSLISSAEPVASKAGLSVRSIFKSYAAEAQLAPATVKRWTPVVERLITHLGHDEATSISRADIVAWKNALLVEDMSNVTIRDVYLAAIKATLQFAVDQDMLSENPAAGIRVRVKDTLHERDKGFSGEEARIILAATLRPPSDKISVEMAAARRWVPWICAYTGARVNEITPLTGRDFLQRDGIPMLRIRAETNKTRKFREVPLYSHLVDQGLLKFAKSRGARPLFYDPRRSRGGSHANPHYKKVGERLAEWVRSLGIDERVAPNHGWRHRFSSLARVLSIPEDVRNILQGHAGAKVSDRYGETWPLVALREIEKLPRYVV
ncbi:MULTISPECIES: DUF6538 domain-containing protein [unclassified Bradyrhizobium]|uniref:DUF6538 domain-containing protein n=1 Tax=unclassified Bradyrhizobium TaxID=2631580 RepID=UPI002FF05407